MDDQSLGPIEVFEVQSSSPVSDSAIPVQKITINNSSSGVFLQHPVMMAMKVKTRPDEHGKRTFQVKAELAAIKFSDNYEDQTSSNDQKPLIHCAY